MDELNDLDAYNGSPEHDSWVDFDYHENTGELSDFSMMKPWMNISITLTIGIDGFY